MSHDDLYEHTRKVKCDECGEVVRVEPGKDFADVHKHKKNEKTDEVEGKSDARSKKGES